jgi:hypothetical protein
VFHITIHLYYHGGWDISVGVVTVLRAGRPMNRASIPVRGSSVLSSPHADPPIFLFNG